MVANPELVFNTHDQGAVRRSRVERIRFNVISTVGQIVTGLNPTISIERLFNSRWWNGSAFSQPSPFLLPMTELSGNEHLDGLYEYVFPVPGVLDFNEVIEYSMRAGEILYVRGRLVVVDNSFVPDAQAVPLARRRFPRRRRIPTRNPYTNVIRRA